jgi:hypothetical protein
MPNGIFPVPEFRSDPTPSASWRPGLAVRIRTRWRRNRLDEELARGADPAASGELRLRAAQLRSPSERARLANALVEILGDARRGEPVTIKPRPKRAEIRACAEDLLALVLRLRDDRPVALRGAAMIARLVSDRGSALHGDGDEDLQQATRAARAALDATGPATYEVATAAKPEAPTAGASAHMG